MKNIEQLKKDLLRILEKSPLMDEKHHAELVYKWVLFLRPDADEPMQIAALAHDIDRAMTGNIDRDMPQTSSYNEFKRDHASRSAQFIAEFLQKNRYPSLFIDRVYDLVENHEIGGDPDSNVLRDADTLAYFEYGIPFYLKRCGLERTKQKIKFMYVRVPDEVRGMVKRMKFGDQTIAKMVEESIGSIS